MNIFIFWLGDEIIKKKVIIKFRNLVKDIKNCNLIIGPSDEEHNYLMKNNKYYATAYKKNKYSFCSDVWRVWKLSYNEGLYIDALFKINKKKFIKFLRGIRNKSLLFVKENHVFYCNGILYNNGFNSFFAIVYRYYSKHRYNSDFTGPMILTKFINKNIDILNENIVIENAKFIDPYNNENIFNYNGMCSWNNNDRSEAKDYFHSCIHDFDRDKKLSEKIKSFFYDRYNFLWPVIKIYYFFKRFLGFISTKLKKDNC